MECRDELRAAVIEHAAAQPRNRRVGLEERPRGERAKRDDNLRLDRRELAKQEWLARRNLVRFRIAIARWTALQHVRDIHIVARQPHRLDHLRQQLTGAADKRYALLVFVRARGLADEHHVSVRIADTEDNLLAPERMQLAPRALAEVVAN